jgi:prevent-host-death family protein
MCYFVLHEGREAMSEGGSPARVGVRELRQNLSVYLRRVEQGEALDVTEHGRLVARLAPALPPETSVLARLAAEHRARPAGRPVSALPQPLQLPPGSRTASEALQEIREDERR